MDEFFTANDTSEQDADAALARDVYARHLGEDWQPEEPGIYRFVGPRRSGPESGLEGDAFDLHASQKPAVRPVET
jgi:hypothetical protein